MMGLWVLMGIGPKNIGANGYWKNHIFIDHKSCSKVSWCGYFKEFKMCTLTCAIRLPVRIGDLVNLVQN
jgi:hypothetical protein